jgi:dihydropyrimidinase
MYSKAGFSIYEGWEVTGWPIVTIRRGEIVYENWKVKGVPGTGKLLKRETWKNLR